MVHRDRGAIAGVLRALAPAVAVMLLSAVCLGSEVGTALGEQVTATAGSTSATLAWTTGVALYDDDIRLRIDRDGVVALDDAPVVSTAFGVLDNEYAPSPLRIVDLDGDGEPEVAVTVYSGGASCCYGVRVYRWDGSTYGASQLLALGGGFRIQDIGGGPTFVTAGQFWLTGAHACAGYPLQLIRYDGGRFADVTADHRKLLRRDARRWQRRWPGDCEERPALDFLAAYLVDLHELGRPGAAERAIARARRHGYFGSNTSLGQITEHTFRRALAQFIARLGPHYLPD